MSNRQVWVVMFLSFVLALTLVVGGFAYGILNSPATTGSFEIEGNMQVGSDELGPILESLSVTSVRGEFSSKVLDILILILSER